MGLRSGEGSGALKRAARGEERRLNQTRELGMGERAGVRADVRCLGLRREIWGWYERAESLALTGDRGLELVKKRWCWMRQLGDQAGPRERTGVGCRAWEVAEKGWCWREVACEDGWIWVWARLRVGRTWAGI